MKKRSTDILQKLIKDQKVRFSMTELAQEYDVTQRTLKNDVTEINQFLEEINISQLICKDGYLSCPMDFDVDLVRHELYEMDTYMYKLSPEERQIYILVSLIRTRKYVVMQRLAHDLYVSRITILSDLEEVKEYLASLDITLLSDAGKGVSLSCSKKQKMELLIELFRKIAVNNENDEFFQRFILNRLQIRYSFSKIFGLLQEYTMANNLVFVDDVFYNIVLYLFAFFNLKEPGKMVTAVPSEMKLSGMDHFMVYVAYHLDEKFGLEDIEDFRVYLKEHELASFVKTIDEVELYKVIRYFLAELDKELKLNLRSDNVLLDSLLMHIKRMKDWGQFEVEFPSQYESYIDYERLEQLVDEKSEILEKFLKYQLSINMKKSIVIHICVSLIRNHRFTSRLAVAVVCPGSMATGKYLEAQIKNYFDFKIVGVFAAASVIEELNQSGVSVDLIISTVSLDTDQYRVLKVHPFLSMEDMNQIQHVSFQCQKSMDFSGIREEQRFIFKLKKLMDEQKISQHLRDDIEKLVLDYQKKNLLRRKTEIGMLMKREFVCISQEEMDWRSAMRKSAEPLLKEGFIDNRYIEKAIENVEEYGDYIVVGPGIALAHANKDFGVYRDGLALLVSPSGILFSDGETRIHFLFCFASTGEKEYVDLMREIVSIGKEKGKVEQLLKLDTESLFDELAIHTNCSEAN